MQKTRINTAIIALTAFVLMLTIASSSFTSVSFAAEDIYGNRMEYPVPAWKKEGPSPWYCSNPGQRYNASCGNYNPTSKAPSTPHILWKHQLWAGGATGGVEPLWGFVEGGQYGTGARQEGIVVAAGKVLYSTGRQKGVKVFCLDEDTGEELWQVEGVQMVSLGFVRNIIIQYNSAVQLVCTDNINIDLETGNKVTSLPRPPGAEYGIYAWNTTWALSRMDIPPEIWYVARSDRGAAYVSMWICDPEGGMPEPTMQWETLFPVSWMADEGRIYGDYFVAHAHLQIGAGDLCMAVMNRHTGQILWERSFQGICGSACGYDKFYVGGADGSVYAFDLKTGDVVWKTKVGATPYWGEIGGMMVGGGNVVAVNFDGYVYCLDAFNGKLKWARYSGDCPYEPYKSWYGTWPYVQNAIGADGKIYATTMDHIEHQPVIPGEKLRCFDDETGEILWEYPTMQRADTIHMAIADGMLFIPEQYTGQMICFGKGPTAVEVSVPKAQIAKGEYTWITGTVTDQSPAQKGTPCVSKESMQAWMTYLHAGTPAPDKKTGVPVTLYAKDSAGTTTTIGTFTTDGDTGQFSCMWTPPNEDIYTITAVFSKDESYWDSWGSTELAVGPAASVSSISGISTPTLTIATVAAVVIGAIVIQKRPFKNRREETEK